MFLSIATSQRPADGLARLLMRRPDRVHEIDVPFGRTFGVFPEASESRCEMALVLDIDPVALGEAAGKPEGALDRTIKDRPYVASAFLAIAVRRMFRAVMDGGAATGADADGTSLPLEIAIAPLRARTDDLISRLFEPLGWRIATEQPSPSGDHSLNVRLSGTQRIAVALSHLCVLIAVADPQMQRWLGEADLRELLDCGAGWIPTHPERDLIVRSFAERPPSAVSAALARLIPEEQDDDPAASHPQRAPDAAKDPMFDAVAATLASAGARSVAILGCGNGDLIARLQADPRIVRIVGVDSSMRALRHATVRFGIAEPPSPDARILLLHGSPLHADRRWSDEDAAVLLEEATQGDPDRCSVIADVVFRAARPPLVIIAGPAPCADTTAGPHEPAGTPLPDWAATAADRSGYLAVAGAPAGIAVFAR